MEDAADGQVLPVSWPVLEQRSKYAQTKPTSRNERGAKAARILKSEPDPGRVRCSTRPLVLTDAKVSSTVPAADDIHTAATAQLADKKATVQIRQPGGWEYLDHTADVQVHAWGATDAEAFAAAAVGMFAYMVDVGEFGCEMERIVVASGHDWESMLYGFLDECLYIFHTEAMAITRVTVTSIDTHSWTVTAQAAGGLFDATQHCQGTEIKAITYSNMQIIHPEDERTQNAPKDRRAQVYVIVDI